jgi:hypothetical protein
VNIPQRIHEENKLNHKATELIKEIRKLHTDYLKHTNQFPSDNEYYKGYNHAYFIMAESSLSSILF